MDIIEYIMIGGIAFGVCTIWGMILMLCWVLVFPEGKIGKWLFSDYPIGGKTGGAGVTTAAAASIIVTSSFTR